MSLLAIILAVSFAAPQAAAQPPGLHVSSFYWGSTEKKQYVHPVLGSMSEERWTRIRRDPRIRRHPRAREIFSMPPTVLVQRESYALVRNTSDKTVKAVTWSYVFYEDAKHEREIRRFELRSKETLKPGEMKFLTAYVDEAAPSAYGDVVIERVEYEGGASWQRGAPAADPVATAPGSDSLLWYPDAPATGRSRRGHTGFERAMIITTANCPSCGGPITFKVGSSIVVICEFCGSAIARTDRDLRNLGKVADLIDTQSPLRVGLEGRFDGRPFVLTGRVQIAHSAGGVWDEWYASFGGQVWGWLAEAQGRFYMTFFRPMQEPSALPPFDYLAPGRPVTIPGAPAPFVVAEVGTARLMGAQGEIPYAVQPGLAYGFADLSGPGGAFATVDYRSAPPVLFAGREVTLAEMGVSATVDEFDAERREVKVARLTCPHCAGPLELRAPDASLRVTCPSCNSLLDVDRGNLTYLRTLEQARPQRFPLGAEATIDGVRMTLVGYVGRGCQVEGEWYHWEEYLLYAPRVGFRWIVNGEGGWFFVEPVAPGDVAEVSAARVRFGGKSFSLKESVLAVVTYVRGEFYWRVEVGEQAATTDYVSRSETLSKELSGGELNWSFGRPVDPAALDRAFDPRAGRASPVVLPPPRVVVPPKPLPSMWAAMGTWLLLTLLAAALWTGLHLTAERRTLVAQTVSFAAETPPPRPAPPPAPDAETQVGWSPGRVEQKVVVGSFEVRSNRNIDVEVRTEGPRMGPLWLRLVDDVTGEVRAESISSSGQGYEKLFESPGPGAYTLYAIRGWTEGDADLRVEVKVTEGVTDFFMPVFLSFLFLLGPALLLVAKLFRAMTSE